MDTLRIWVTEEGLLIPKAWLEGLEEVEIRRQNGFILVVAVSQQDPIYEFGEDPIITGVTDLAANHDRYLYTS